MNHSDLYGIARPVCGCQAPSVRGRQKQAAAVDPPCICRFINGTTRHCGNFSFFVHSASALRLPLWAVFLCKCCVMSLGNMYTIACAPFLAFAQRSAPTAASEAPRRRASGWRGSMQKRSFCANAVSCRLWVSILLPARPSLPLRKDPRPQR